jgi:hypothetical protein
MFLGDFLQSLEKREDQAKLSCVSKISSFDEDTQKSLNKMASGDLNSRVCGIIINAILTQNKKTFLFSRGVVKNLLICAKSLNLTKRVNINGSEFKELCTCLRNLNVIKLVSPGNYKIGQASIFQVSNQDLLNQISLKRDSSFFKEQEAFCFSIFNDFLEKPTKPTKVSYQGDLPRFPTTEKSEYNEQSEKNEKIPSPREQKMITEIQRKKTLINQRPKATKLVNDLKIELNTLEIELKNLQDNKTKILSKEEYELEVIKKYMPHMLNPKPQGVPNKIIAPENNAISHLPSLENCDDVEFFDEDLIEEDKKFEDNGGIWAEADKFIAAFERDGFHQLALDIPPVDPKNENIS